MQKIAGQRLALEALAKYGTIRSDKLRRVTGYHKITNRCKEMIEKYLLNVTIQPVKGSLVEYTLLQTRHNQKIIRRVLGQ